MRPPLRYNAVQSTQPGVATTAFPCEENDTDTPGLSNFHGYRITLMPMAKEKKRIPKKGDRVTAVGNEGVFAVYSVDSSLRAVDLQQVGSGLRLATIPWDSITFLDQQDTSQAAC
jgi:hypothetical protein